MRRHCHLIHLNTLILNIFSYVLFREYPCEINSIFSAFEYQCSDAFGLEHILLILFYYSSPVSMNSGFRLNCQVRRHQKYLQRIKCVKSFQLRINKSKCFCLPLSAGELNTRLFMLPLRFGHFGVIGVRIISSISSSAGSFGRYLSTIATKQLTNNSDDPPIILYYANKKTIILLNF